MNWYEEAIQSLYLTEESEGYLLGRGLCDWQIQDNGIGLWDSTKISQPCPDPSFRSLYGPKGEVFHQRVVVPLWGPHGDLLGWEGRNWSIHNEKKLTQFLLPKAEWNPVFVGLTQKAMTKLWEGGNAWVVEGVYDMGAIGRIAPSQDVVLATLRAKVSSRHIDFFQRFLQGKVYLVYDNDATGRRQTNGYTDPVTGKRRWGAIESMSRVGIRCQDVPYKGKDPGEVWESGGLPALQQSFRGVINVK